MPIQLRIIAIAIALAFFVYIILLIQKDKAEVRHMRKWLGLSTIILVGAFVIDFASEIAHFLGFTTLTSLVLFILTGLLLLIVLRFQVSLISAERHLKVLTQELSMLKKRVKELEEEQNDKK